MNITSEIVLAITKAASCKQRKDKVAALKKYDSTLLRIYLQWVIDPQHNFYITTAGLPKPDARGDVWEFSSFLALITCMAQRTIPAAIVKNTLAGFLGDASCELRTLMGWAIDRQLPGNIGETIINTAFPGLIYHQPYGGVSSYNPDTVEARFDWDRGVILQEKADGLALFIAKDHSGKVTVHTRQGQDVTRPMSTIVVNLTDRQPHGTVLHVEACMSDQAGDMIPRVKANGAFNSVFQDGRTLLPWELYLVCLDMIDFDDFYDGIDKMSCEYRLSSMTDMVRKYNNDDITAPFPHVRVPMKHIVNSFREAQKIVGEWVGGGLEGGVLKDPMSPWQDTRMVTQMKLKNEFTCSLIVVAWVMHKKHPTWVGSLVCESHDGILKTKVGSGLNEDIESQFNRCIGAEPFLGRVIDVKSECITKNNALQHPRITDVRLDKTKADTFEEVQAAYRDSIALYGLQAE